MSTNVLNVNEIDLLSVLDNVDMCKGLVYLKNGDDTYRLNGVLSDALLKVKYLNAELENAVLIFYDEDDLKIMKEFIH